MKRKLLGVHKIDSRKLNEVLNDKIVDVTITSPPYFDLKDYGDKKQIGYGQKYETYLSDLKTVFKHVYECSKNTSSLWVIIDSYRKNGEVTPLPFDFSNKIKEVGWKLQEIIIWEKDRTVPWTHKGQMRSLFEYILLFSKSNSYNFFINKIRDYQSLKKWWVKYPERYNPEGKTPTAIWHFDIPTQGSWGNGYIRHFCPLPEEMISQILKLTTKEGDIVLDPFAGSGAVLSRADSMKRKFIGFELNAQYIKMFETYLKDTRISKRRQYQLAKKTDIPQKKFKKLIINLRALKYAKVLQRKIRGAEKNCTIILVEKNKAPLQNENSVASVFYHFLILDKEKKAIIQKRINRIISKPPLSKFGIEPTFSFSINSKAFIKKFKDQILYTYTQKSSSQYQNKIMTKNFSILKPSETILSPIQIDINERDHE